MIGTENVELNDNLNLKKIYAFIHLYDGKYDCYFVNIIYSFI